jgi:Fe-S-cluster containining protein
MCCDGTLYSYVTLIDDDEVNALKAHDPNLAILMRGERLTFDQPCRQHNGKGCTAYASRPDTCSRYFCMLLRKVALDEVTPFEALAIIQEARALIENVKEYAHFEPGEPIAASTWETYSPGASRDSRVAWERALRWVRIHFLSPDPDATPESVPDSSGDPDDPTPG